MNSLPLGFHIHATGLQQLLVKRRPHTLTQVHSDKAHEAQHMQKAAWCYHM
jgi:hypothetical protein